MIGCYPFSSAALLTSTKNQVVNFDPLNLAQDAKTLVGK